MRKVTHSTRDLVGLCRPLPIMFTLYVLGPNRVVQLSQHHQFQHRDVQFLPQNIALVTVDNNKLNYGVNLFCIATIFKFLVDSNAMVAHERGVQR
jgi:hypothetical protein